MAKGGPLARSLVAPGVREAEAWLLGELEAHAQEAQADPRRLVRPVRVIVPGGPLRASLVDRMVRALGGAVAGVQVQTLWSLAIELLEGAGETVRTGAHLFELLARREAAREGPLREALDGLDDGTGLAAGAISDLLSARLESADPRALDGALASLPRAERERTQALARAAHATAAALRERGRARFADVYEAAARLVEREGPATIPARSLYVHGFSGATGQAGAFLAALLRRADACLLLVEPAAQGGDRGDPQRALSIRLSRRLLGTDPEPLPTAAAEPARLAAFHAWGAGDELREVALRIRALLEGGARPESIGVVARTLDPRALALRRAFAEHGVPFSGGVEPPGTAPLQRRLDALLDVLRDGGRASADRWLDALAEDRLEHREDVRAALRASGVARLAEVAALADADWLTHLEQVPLPHRGGIPDEPTPDARPRRRTLAREHLLTAATAAQGALELVAAWPEGAPLEAHFEQLDRLAERLGLPRADAGDELSDGSLGAVWASALVALEELEGVSSGPTRAEITHLLEAALQGALARPLGGAGAGVRVLGAQEARGAAFEHLFLVGLERGAFPRAPRSDPLLPDRAREALAAALPDLEPRERQHAEERWLFRTLAGAAPQVTLSWLHADEQGREVAPSPFVLRELGTAGVEALRIEHRREKLAERRPGTARELAVAAALTAPRGELERALALSLEEAAERFGDAFLPAGCSPRELAAARMEVLAELEPDRRTREGRARLDAAGPWTGAVGAGALVGTGPVYVTRLEALARCPWQGFLVHGLGIDTLADPLHDLPDLDPLVLGNAVHGALQRLLAPGAPRRTLLADALARPGSVPDLADPAGLDRALRAAALQALEDAGLHLPGLAQALVERARPYVDSALARLGGGLQVLGAEVDGTVATPVELAFRADLVLREGERVVLVDFKTGKPISEASRQSTREKHLRERTLEGQALQGMAYALAVDSACGCYLFVKPDVKAEGVRVVVERTDASLLAAYADAVARLSDAWHAGAVPPRPEEPDGKANRSCEWCDVRMACLRDDTGYRRRLLGLADAPPDDAQAAPLAARLASLLRPAGTRTDDDAEDAG